MNTDEKRMNTDSRESLREDFNQSVFIRGASVSITFRVFRATGDRKRNVLESEGITV